jgi:hypothetical protein
VPAPIPKLKSVEVIDRVNVILKDLTHFIPEDDLVIRRLLKDAENSIKTNAAMGHAALASVYQLTGNADKARHHSNNAIELASGDYVLLGNKSSILINLGFHSEGLSVYQKSANPELGQMTFVWPQGYACGAFTTMVKHLNRARKMKLDLKGLDVETAEKAAAVLEKTGVSESQVAAALDLIGGVLREHKQFFVGPSPQVTVFNEPGHDPFIRMTYGVALSPSAAHDLYREFIAQVVQAQVPIPSCLSVSVRSSKPEHARQAA